MSLFKSRREAETASRGGLVQLYEAVMKRDLAWLRGELDVLCKRGDLYSPASKQVRDDAYACLVDQLFASDPVLALTRERFEARRRYALEHLRGLSDKCIALVGSLLSTRLEILRCQFPYDGLAADLQRLLPDRFLLSTPFDRLEDLQRYLKAVLIRVERARLDPAKDAARAAQVREFESGLVDLLQGAPMPDAEPRRRRLIEEFRQMLEEWRVSLFAQELGTSMPVSAKRLRAKLNGIEAAASTL
jgi:ATP-dependent helicase HrpA